MTEIYARDRSKPAVRFGRLLRPLFLLLAVAACSGDGAGLSFDVLIRGGRIYDGTRAAPVVADIGILGDRIVAIGALAGAGRKTIDASGCIVTPGFIDVGARCDLTFQEAGWRRFLAYIQPAYKGNHNFLLQGVTTVVTGNAGRGYGRTHKWLGMVDAMGFGTNVGHLVPYETVRRRVTGDTQPVQLTEAQGKSLGYRLIEELQHGALGVSTDLAAMPEKIGGMQERIAAAKLVRDYGGVFVARPAEDAGSPVESGQSALAESVGDILRIGRDSGAAVHISRLRLRAPFSGAAIGQTIDPLVRARREGAAVTADLVPYDADDDLLSMRLAGRERFRSGVRDACRTDPERQAVHRGAEELLRRIPPERIVVVDGAGRPERLGRNLREIAVAEKRTAAEAYAAMVCEGKPIRALFFDISERMIRRLLAREFVGVVSDAATATSGRPVHHPRSSGCFPRLLRKYVLEDQTLSLIDAVRSITSLPAETFHIRDRGRIAVGFHADIAVIDLKTLREGASYKAPGTAPQGVRYLLVNGVLSIDRGEPTGLRGGRALKRA